MSLCRTAALGLLSALLLCTTARAEPSMPWMPSTAARHAIQLLVDEAGLDLSATQWPLPQAAVQRALDALPAQLPTALDLARERVQRELRAHLGSAASLTLRNHADALAGFGDDATPGSSLLVRSPTLQAPYVAARLGGRVEARGHVDRDGVTVRLDDSALAVELLGLQLQAWAHRSWWGPGWQSALELSNNAPALAAVGFQRASASRSDSPWLAWMGPWNFELFVARAEGTSQPRDPYLLGTRLTLRPFSHLEIGLTRTAQWGGEGRDSSATGLARLLLGVGSNADDAAAQSADPGNHLAGFDLRLRCPFGLRCAAYTQLSGEDQAGLWPSHTLGLYGVETWTAEGTDRFFAEVAETGCEMPVGQAGVEGCAYRNYAYPQGYVSAGRWLGASVGPDSRLLTLGWIDARHGGSLKLHLGRVGSRIGSYSPFVEDPRSSGDLYGFSARRSFAWGAATLTPEIDWSRVDAPNGPRTEARVGLNLSMSLDGATAALDRQLDSASATSPEGDLMGRLVTGAFLIGSSALLDPLVDKRAQHYDNSVAAQTVADVGNAIPFVAFGLAGLSWLSQPDTAQGELGFSAAAAGLSAVLTAEVVKLAVDRARPVDNLGARNFGDTSRAQSSFPSIHTTLAWAVLTPYAKEYDAPWLYAAAALTNVARVTGRDHWLSDTVAGALMGYWFGDYFYRRHTASAEEAGTRIWVTPRSVVLSVPFK